ncbi:hypothetical protein IV203_019041 [Nitzschia inconspicua]|uniref:Uncharacterized protein n=1 Tax=Nitzschia inconspicua TaxID=303405 RepID=A0A9K3KKS7_9STRA|nr:hypothetical protein IV203_022636 [Nitzschia inconspicua]KAG7370471.1 hypothetical protein IV203_019041 [Nitzschia inconspicua]
MISIPTATTAFTPKPFVPMSLVSPDPVNPKSSAISPNTAMPVVLNMSNRYANNGNNNNNNNNGYFRNINYYPDSNNNNNGGGGGGGDYYNTYGTNYRRGGGGSFGGGSFGGGSNFYGDGRSGGYNGDSFRSGNNNYDNDRMYQYPNQRRAGRDEYRGPYAPPPSPYSSHSMQYNSNQAGRYNQYRFDDYDNEQEYFRRNNRGAPLMNNRRLGNLNNNYNYNNNAYPNSNQYNNNNNFNNNNGGGLMRYQGNDYYDSSQSFYNLEGKRVRRYDPLWDNGLYNQDALYDSNNNYLSNNNNNRRNNNNSNGGALRRYDPYMDEGRGYYNPNALYGGQSLGTRRYNLDPYYDEDRFGWGGGTNNSGGRSRYSREYGYDDALLDQEYRRSSGYDQRRRPPSAVMGSGVGYDDRRERYGNQFRNNNENIDNYYNDRRRPFPLRRGGGGDNDYYSNNDYDDYDSYYYNNNNNNIRNDFLDMDARSNYANRPPRIREPFVKNMEDDAMESMRSGKGGRRRPGDSRSQEVSPIPAGRRSSSAATRSRREEEEDYAMNSAGPGRRTRGGGSTVNGSYYPPPRGEANGGLSIDDLKEML